MEKVLVTGGCGFIGANLIKKMTEKGFEIRVLDNFSRGSRDYINEFDLEVVEGDIRDEHMVATVLKSIDGVIHLAAYGSVVESVEDPVENFNVNVRGTFTMLNQCRKAGIKKFIFSSTGGALIGNAIPPVNEESLPRPISPYGSSKLCCEAYCSSFSHSYGMDITSLRFANVIGPISWHKKGAVTAFMKAVMDEKEIVIYGDGTATRDYLYVDDLCEGIMSAYKKGIEGFTPLHLASGRDVSVSQLASAIMAVAGKPDHPIRYLDKRVGEVEKNFASYELARKLIGFKPSTTLESALEKTWVWFDNYSKLAS